MIKPLISVIVPVYNVEKYIRRCIKSILEQTYKEIELILIDDGSTDNSKFICIEEAKLDERIRFISKRNEGAGYTRNLGMDLAKGRYVMFVDSDDYLMCTCLERVVEVAEKENCDIVKFGWKRGYEENYSILPKPKNYQIYTNYEAFEDRRVNICVCGKLFRRELISDIRYPKVSIYDDEFITYKWLYAAKKIVLLDEIYYYYYMSPNSLMRKKKEVLPLGYLKAYEERKRFFAERNEKRLASITSKEYAIRLMLSYLTYNQYYSAEISKKEILELFMHEYRMGKYTAVNIKERSVLRIFSINPKLMSICFNILKGKGKL